MNAQHAERLKRIREGRVARAKELMVHMEILGVEIGWEGEYTTFTPMTSCPPKLIEEATILSGEIKAIKEGRIK